ncbi:MAG: serine/threonine-protein kinase, partial [Myxococcota bacterium]
MEWCVPVGARYAAAMDHPGADHLLATPLDPATEDHLAGCPACRVERRRLIDAERFVSSPQTTLPPDPSVARWSDALTRIAMGDFVELIAGDGLVPLRIERWGDSERLLAFLPADVSSVLERRQATLGPLDMPDAIVAWDAVTRTEDGWQVVALLPPRRSLPQHLGIDPLASVRWAMEAATAMATLHERGAAHGGLSAGAPGVTPRGSIVLPPPALHRHGSFAEDRRQLGELIRGWRLADSSAQAPIRGLDEVCERLEDGRFESDVAIVQQLAEVNAVVRLGAGRYTPDVQLGVGGMGEVWRVRDAVMRRDVALKLQHPEHRDEDAFVDEARRTAALSHPGIVAVHEFGRLEDGRAFYTMEEVSGPEFSEVLQAFHERSGPHGFGVTPNGWNLRRLAEVIARVGDALGYAHSQGIVHGDVKPANIKVGPHGQVVLMDWGLAVARGTALALVL